IVAAATITRLQLLSEQIRLAQTDGLTALLNRTRLLAQARDLLKADPGPRSVAFFLFDLDHFKPYNDTNGHLAADALLHSLSHPLGERTREEELVGRYGGEEFLVVIPNVDREQALRAAERLRVTIASTPFAHGEKQPGGRISISGGISIWPIDGEDLQTLLKRADLALYAAKRAGRNQVCAQATAQLDAESVRVGRAVAWAVAEDQESSGESGGSAPDRGRK